MSALDWLPWIRARRSRELADEIQAHLEMAAADRVARGELPDEAAARARRELGNPGLVQEVARDQWGATGLWLERLGQDLRLAARMLRRTPGFAVVAILTIALGVGSTTAIFSVVDATLLHPLPYPHPEQLVRIEDDLLGLGSRDVGMSTPEWRDLERSGVFEYVSPTWYDDNNLTGVARAQRVSILIVAPNYFTLLGVKPQLGVAFDPADRTPGFNEHAVISDGLWRRMFGGDSSVVGRIVQLDSDSYRVVGVMPPGFQAPGRTQEERGTEVWPAFGYAGAPLNDATIQSRAPLFFGAVARLKPGLSVADAQRRIDALVHTLREKFPADYPPRSDWTIRLVPLQTYVTGDVRQALLFLLGAVALLLLISCANVANLVLARATTREREMALRQALGGAPERLMRQLITENLLLSVAGGLVGLFVLVATKAELIRLVPAGMPRLNAISISWAVMLFAIAASILAGTIFGLAPALGVRNTDVTRVLKQEGRSTTSSRLQNRSRALLVVAEFALSLILLSTAGLLVRSFWTILNAPLGFDPANVTVVRTRLPYPNDPKEDLYATVGDEARFVRELTPRLRSLAGVQQVALGSGAAVPLDHQQQDLAVLRVLFERGAVQGNQPVFVAGASVSADYFDLLGMKLIRGRLLNDFDTDETPPVAVIDQAMARTYWPNEDPLGKRLKLTPRATSWTTVVGIVADARTESLSSPVVPHIYASLYQKQGKHLAILIRGHVDAAAIAREVQEQVQTINPALPVFRATPLNDIVSRSLAVRRLSMQLLAIFAITALLLAMLGIYGVISYMVSERSHEIGVRMALGAQQGEVLRLVMRQGAVLGVLGAAIGLGAAFAVSRALAGLLVGVGPSDPVTFGTSTLVLIAVAVAGCYVPARRATRLDPIIALRS